MFTRGQTQICNICTLAPLSEAQRLDGLDENETSKRYMHHYNFPSYSVGETKPSRGPGRREIGHGALAERALLPVLPSEEEFPYAIRTVSETFESNGSTSQASICASTMSLMAAGVQMCIRDSVEPDASSACEVLFGLLEEEKISEPCAEALYTGIAVSYTHLPDRERTEPGKSYFRYGRPG